MHDSAIGRPAGVNSLYLLEMVASIALNFNFEGSVVLNYTNLNVDAL
jgi:hypothetical protein